MEHMYGIDVEHNTRGDGNVAEESSENKLVRAVQQRLIVKCTGTSDQGHFLVKPHVASSKGLLSQVLFFLFGTRTMASCDKVGSSWIIRLFVLSYRNTISSLSRDVVSIDFHLSN